MKNTPRKETRALQPKQARFIDAYLTLGDAPAAARFVGVDRSTGSRWLQLPAVRDELAGRMQERGCRVQDALFERELAAFAALDVDREYRRESEAPRDDMGTRPRAEARRRCRASEEPCGPSVRRARAGSRRADRGAACH